MSELPERTPELLVYMFPPVFGLPVVANDVVDPFALNPEDALELEDLSELHGAGAVQDPSVTGRCARRGDRHPMRSSSGWRAL